MHYCITSAVCCLLLFFFFKQKTAYEIYQCDWSSDVCSSDLVRPGETVEIELELAATGVSTLDPERVFIRVEGKMPEVPRGLAPVSKLWRKLVTERSGRSVRRFGQYVVPADLVVPPSHWPAGRWTQSARLRIPTWAEPGDYAIQVTVHDWTWHENRDLRDYLQDIDRFSAPPVATIRIRD